MITGDKGDKGDKGENACCDCPQWYVYPDPSEVCEGEEFTQYRYDSCTGNEDTQNAIGTGLPQWSEWYPDPSEVCEGEEFTQYRYDYVCNGSDTQNAIGTGLPQWGEWTPDPSTVCEGQEFLQYRYDLNGRCTADSQNSIGTAVPNWSSWTPDTNTVCEGQEFQQTRTDLNGRCTEDSQNSIGTAVPNWSPWEPDASTVCAGQEFQQTRTDLNGYCTEDSQNSIGTDCCLTDSVSVYDYHMWDECPGAGQPCPSGTRVSTCSNFTDSGYVTSKQFLKTCIQGLTPRANVVNVRFDNTGTIGDLSDNGSTRPECSLGTANGQSSVQIIDEGDYVRLRLSYSYTNANHGGPYGITGDVTFNFT